MKKKQRTTIKEKYELDATFIDEQGKCRRPTLIAITDVFTNKVVGYTLIRPEGKVTRIHTQRIAGDK